MSTICRTIRCPFLCSLLLACGQGGASDVCQGLAAGDLLVTEVMIDPDGADTGGEWIELFNPGDAGVELKGLTLYAKDLDGAKLSTHLLRAGAVPAGGLFVAGDARGSTLPAWVDVSYGPDLGALGNLRGAVGLRCGALVLDELEWEAPATPGVSRMRDSAGAWCDTPADHRYSGANAGTPRQPNPACPPLAASGATCVEGGVARALRPASPGDLLITEVMASPSGPDATSEWIELLALASVDLNGLTLSNGAGTRDVLEASRCLSVAAGTYALLARNDDPFLNGGLPPVVATYGLGLSSANERLGLARGDAGIDEVALWASSSGVAWQLDPARLSAELNNDPASFCHAPLRWAPDGGGDRGSPGAPNPPCASPTGPDAGLPSGTCVDRFSGRLRLPRRPGLGELVITEWMANPLAVSDAEGEYVELLATADVDLNDVVLGDTSASSKTLKSADCLFAAAGTSLLFAASADPAKNGGLPPVDGLLPFELGNEADSLWVRGPDGGLLDSVSYAGTQPGVSTQLALGLAGPLDNDVATHLCFTPDAGANRYGKGDLGTPGRPNVACP